MEYIQSCSEVFYILNHIEEKQKNKRLVEIINFLDKYRDKNATIHIDLKKPIENQHLEAETTELLAYIYQNYLCESEEKIEFLREKNRIQEENKNQKIEIKYSFEKTQIETSTLENLPIKIQEETFFMKILKKIKELFSKV